MTVAELTSSDVVDGTSITYRQLAHWVTEDAIKPTVRGHGRGCDHQWSNTDRHRLQIIDQILTDLTTIGITQTNVAFIRYLWRALGADADRIHQGTITIRLGLEDT